MEHHRTCNLCEAMCGVVITHDGLAVSAIRGDADDVFSRGHICPKATALGDLHTDPDRLRTPVRRVPGATADTWDWEPIGWDEALDEVARRLVAVQRDHGPHAVGTYAGNPSVHNAGTVLYALLFWQVLGTWSRFSATSLDQLPHMLAALEMFGHQLLMPVPDIDRAHYVLMLGANPLVSNGSIMTAGNAKGRLAAISARGGKVVVIDPRRTRTAAAADEHHFIRPGTDALLLAALIHTLFAEELVRLGRLAPFTDGLDTLQRAVAPLSPAAVADAVGISETEITRLARTLATTEGSLVYGRMGICVQRFGGLNAWLINALNVLIGALDRPGGMMFTTPAVDLVALAARMGNAGHFDKGRSSVRGLPEFGGEYPASALAEEIAGAEDAGDGPIRALVTLCGNPVLSSPNGRRLERALDSLDFMVAIDLYINETSRHADLILPPTSHLEQSHFDLVFHALAVRNTVKWSPALFDPPRGAKADWQILCGIATRIVRERARGARGLARVRGLATTGVAGLAGPALERLGPDGIIGLLLRWGPHGAGLKPRGGGLTMKRLRAAPHGIDLGALTPQLPARLYTEGKRIRLAPERLMADMPRLVAAAAPAQPDRAGGLLLIGRRQLRNNNSWLHNLPRMVKGKARCTLLVHPTDAASRGLEAGSDALIVSRVGQVRAPVEITTDIMPGVVSLPHGFGHHREGTRQGVARAHAGVSANDVTDDQDNDPLSGVSVLNGVPVEVHACG